MDSPTMGSPTVRPITCPTAYHTACPTSCWCGNNTLSPFGQGYQRCDICQTLVAGISPAQANPRVRDEQSDLYGRDYWFSHQTADLNCPDLIKRSRTDLADRAIHWLRSLLGFKLPPAKVLEIGCAHGGFVAMLNQAGYQASGLELSPWIVKFAAETFGIDVLTGPIEDQSLPEESLDAIIIMDVMEHLPDPTQTLERCARLLRPDGILLMQTPEYPVRQSLKELQTSGHQFPQMLDPGEHLFLFSRNSATEIFRRLGLNHIQFIPAIFGFYDMSFIVSRQAIETTPPSGREAALTRSNSGRMLQALLDSDSRRLELLEKYRTLRDQK